MVLSKLSENGYKLKELKLDDSIYEEITEILVAVLVNDGGAKERAKVLKGEKELDAFASGEPINKL